jgi:superfamily II DNA helicase RecQ
MPESDEAVQLERQVEDKIGIRPCLWQIKVVRMILEQWDVIEIAATGSGKSLPYWMALLFIENGIVVLVTPLKLLGKQFVEVLEKNDLSAISMTASNSNNELFEVCALARWQCNIHWHLVFTSRTYLKGSTISLSSAQSFC